MIQMALSMENDTNASTSIGAKDHIIPLHNHPNMTNDIQSLMTPSASCHRKHINVMYVPKTNMPVNVTYNPCVPASSFAHMRQLCQYTCLI